MTPDSRPAPVPRRPPSLEKAGTRRISLIDAGKKSAELSLRYQELAGASKVPLTEPAAMRRDKEVGALGWLTASALAQLASYSEEKAAAATAAAPSFTAVNNAAVTGRTPVAMHPDRQSPLDKQLTSPLSLQRIHKLRRIPPRVLPWPPS